LLAAPWRVRDAQTTRIGADSGIGVTTLAGTAATVIVAFSGRCGHRTLRQAAVSMNTCLVAGASCVN